MSKNRIKFLKEIWRGKGLGRTLTNFHFIDQPLFGLVLDLGGGGRASIFRFLKLVDGVKIITADINPHCQPDLVLNIEKDVVPINDQSCDFILAFGLLEHLCEYNNLIQEVKRLLKPQGIFFVTVPFLVNIHPDPHDYLRMTREKIEQLFTSYGFGEIKIDAIGRGPFTAAYSLIEFMLPRVLRCIFVPLAMGLDLFIQRIKPQIEFRERYPLAYAVRIKL